MALLELDIVSVVMPSSHEGKTVTWVSCPLIIRDNVRVGILRQWLRKKSLHWIGGPRSDKDAFIPLTTP